MQETDEERLNEAQESHKGDNQAKINQNANAVNNLANAASKSSNGYARAAGKALKAADKISGGKASQAIGKKINKNPLLNKAVELANKKAAKNNTNNRINSATNKNHLNNFLNHENLFTKSENSKNLGVENNTNPDDTTTEAGSTFNASAKIFKAALLVMIPILVIVIFSILFITASQTYLSVIGLGHADSTKQSDADKKLKYDNDQKLDEGIGINNVFIDNGDEYTLIFTKTDSLLINISNSRYSESDLSELEDFYSNITTYESGKYDMDTVYKFFFKLMYIYRYYADNYKVDLDVSLIMSILKVQSDDINEVFVSNTVGYTKGDNSSFDYNKDWSKYKPTAKNSSHDIEILAQAMVKKEGNVYSLVADDDVKEFLRKYLEEKYFINSESSESSESDECYISSPFAKYSLTDDQLKILTAVALREQGSNEGAAAEASLMANLFELRGSKYGTGADGLYNYVVNSGWFGSNVSSISTKNVTEEALDAVSNVLVLGRRTLPGYVDEHDCITCGIYGEDIVSVTINGEEVDKYDKSNYIQHVSVLKNKYGSTYTFYSFPTEGSDPFGYTSEDLRNQIGDFHYNYDGSTSSGCTPECSECTSDFATDFITWLVAIANDDTHGYSQSHRAGGIDYDCSSLVYFGLLNSGFTTDQMGTYPFTTKNNQRSILKRVGFEEIKFSNLSDGKSTDNLKAGDILWTSGHTEVYIGNGMNVGAHSSETGGINGEYGDQTGKEISVTNFWNDNWQYVYRYVEE